jgi:hypothetical protein
MALLETVLPALRAGKKIRQKNWASQCEISVKSMRGWLEADWEIVGEEPKYAFTYMSDGTIAPIGTVNEGMQKKDQRGLYAAMFLQGIVTGHCLKTSEVFVEEDISTSLAVQLADALIKKLEE